MGFSYFIAVLGLVLSTALLGFIAAGVHETRSPEPAERRSSRTSLAVAAGLALVAITQGMVLAGSDLIRPVWMLYLLLAVLPAVTGYLARRVLARRFSRRAG